MMNTIFDTDKYKMISQIGKGSGMKKHRNKITLFCNGSIFTEERIKTGIDKRVLVVDFEQDYKELLMSIFSSFQEVCFNIKKIIIDKIFN